MPLHLHSDRCDQLQSQEQSITVKRTSSAPGPALQGGGIRRKTEECDEERDEESSHANQCHLNVSLRGPARDGSAD